MWKGTPMEIKQLLLSKYLFEKGKEFLKNNDTISCGVAVSLFQDSTEMVLRAIAKHVDAKVGKIEAYESFWEKIRAANKNVNNIEVPFKAQMADVNNARVSFKHFGQPPNPAHAITFSDYVEQFLRECMKLFFDVDYDNISFADLIQNTEIREIIKQAEQFNQETKFTESMVECAKATYLISNFLNSIIPQFEIGMSVSDHLIHHDPDRYLEKAFRDTYGHLNSLRLLGTAALLNINLSDFIKFHSLIPSIFKFKGGAFTNATLKKSNYEDHEVRFCLKYVIDYALIVQNHLHEADNRKHKKTLNDIDRD